MILDCGTLPKAFLRSMSIMLRLFRDLEASCSAASSTRLCSMAPEMPVRNPSWTRVDDVGLGFVPKTTFYELCVTYVSYDLGASGGKDVITFFFL